MSTDSPTPDTALDVSGLIVELRVKAREMFPNRPEYMEDTFHWRAATALEAMQKRIAALQAIDKAATTHIAGLESDVIDAEARCERLMVFFRRIAASNIHGDPWKVEAAQLLKEMSDE